MDKKWVPAAIGLNYEVRAGEVLAIVGESGSGKSASSMALLGLLPSNSRVTGSVKLAGQELLGTNEANIRAVRGKEVAVIFQEPMTALNPVYTVGAQIVETVRLHSEVSPDEARLRALRMLELVELPDPEKAFRSYPHQLSGGQRQRAMIAQSLSCDPEAAHRRRAHHGPRCDRPGGNPGPHAQPAQQTGQRHRADHPRHGRRGRPGGPDRRDAPRRDRGNRTAAEIFHNPQHEYTKALLAAVPHLGQGGADAAAEVDVTAALAAATHAELTSIPEEQLLRRERENAAALAAAAAAKPQGEPVLELTDVAIEYPKQGRVPAFRAVEGANLVIYPGQVVGLVGESGSGKTTIGRAAVGLLPVAAGTMKVVGQDISAAKRNGRQLHEMRRHVGMVFQDPSSSLNPRLPIGESIGEPMFLAGVAKGAELQQRIEALLDQVELPRNYRNRYPHELSGGQKQRVGIARALSLKPKLMVADEPTSALDVSVQAKVLDLFQNLQKELGFACLFVTHDLAVVDVLADRICVMQRGRIVEQGTRDQILRNPQEPYTQRLLAAVPLPDPEKQRERRELRAQLLAAEPS